LATGIPDGHIERAGGVRPVAVAAWLLVGHEGLPDGDGIEVVVLLVDERFRIRRLDARYETLTQDAALRIAAVGGEAVADDRLARRASTSVSTATRLMVIVENEMKALRISEAIGAVASRMRVIFMAVIPASGVRPRAGTQA
jgi:hypothetical protein